MANIKILHITTFQGGGAGIAAMRLHNALIKHGYESRFLFLDKGKQSDTVFQYRRIIYLWQLMMRIFKKLGFPLTLEQKNDYAIRKYKYKVEMFSFANTPYVHLHQHHLVKEADLIHLHWVSNFVDYKSFFGGISKPVVWTMHDMNPFQGGFHYKEDENRYGKALHDLNLQQINIKKQAVSNLSSGQLSIVTPSAWMKRLSGNSDLLGRFPHHHIANGIDTRIFKFSNKKKPAAGNRKINVLFVAESLHNYRKGFDFVLTILQEKAITDKCNFMAVGEVKKSSRIPQIAYKGIITEEQKMSDLYNEADIFLLPSREDNLPNSMVESLCCGTPVVGFAVGGLKETIAHGRNGYLSDELSATGLASALLSCIHILHTMDNESIAAEAQLKFSSEIQIKTFVNLYKNCLHLQPAKPLPTE